MAGQMHAIIIEGDGHEERLAEAVMLLKAHFHDDPEAAARLDKAFAGGIEREDATGIYLLDPFEDLVILKNPNDKKVIIADQIDSLAGLFKQKSFASTGRACLIPYGEQFSEIVQNKMLKLLEEPIPGSVIIILVQNADRFLPTVRSRCLRKWLGYGQTAEGQFGEDIKALGYSLIFGRGALAEAAQIMSRYEGSKEDAAEFLNAFQLFMRNFLVGREAPELIGGDAESAQKIRESASKVEDDHAAKMRKGVALAEKAKRDIDLGYRTGTALRAFALAMRSV